MDEGAAAAAAAATFEAYEVPTTTPAAAAAAAKTREVTKKKKEAQWCMTPELASEVRDGSALLVGVDPGIHNIVGTATGRVVVQGDEVRVLFDRTSQWCMSRREFRHLSGEGLRTAGRENALRAEMRASQALRVAVQTFADPNNWVGTAVVQLNEQRLMQALIARRKQFAVLHAFYAREEHVRHR